MTQQLDFSELPPKSFCCERSTINQEWPLKAFFLFFVCPQNMWMALSFDVGSPQQSYLSRTLVIDWRKLNSFGKRFFKSPKGPEIRIPISLWGNFPATPFLGHPNKACTHYANHEWSRYYYFFTSCWMSWMEWRLLVFVGWSEWIGWGKCVWCVLSWIWW